MGEGLSTTYPPNPKSKSKIEIRIEVADRDCGVRGSSPPLCGGAPLFRRCKRPALPDAGGARPGPDSVGGGPAAPPLPSCEPFPVRSWKKCRPEAFPAPRSTRPWSRFQPLFRPFFPVSRPFSAAAAGLVGVCRTCPGADPAADLPDLLTVQAAEGLPDLGRVS